MPRNVPVLPVTATTVQMAAQPQPGTRGGGANPVFVYVYVCVTQSCGADAGRWLCPRNAWQVLAGALITGYPPPAGFCYDGERGPWWRCANVCSCCARPFATWHLFHSDTCKCISLSCTVSCSDPPVMDDPRLEDYNVPYLVDLFVNTCVSCMHPLEPVFMGRPFHRPWSSLRWARA